MTDIRTQAMTSTLLADYPRAGWDAHPGFHAKTRDWLAAHRAFRIRTARLKDWSEAVLNGDMDPDAYADALGRTGEAFLRTLHGHHHWEDHSYFPELSAADPRFGDKLAVLETDHVALDERLDRFARHANLAIVLTQLDPQAARDETGRVLDVVGEIGQLLDRHLTDEKEIAVPIILHHRLRG